MSLINSDMAFGKSVNVRWIYRVVWRSFVYAYACIYSQFFIRMVDHAYLRHLFCRFFVLSVSIEEIVIATFVAMTIGICD